MNSTKDRINGAGLLDADKVNMDLETYETRAGAFPLKVEFPGDNKSPDEGAGSRIIGTYVKRDSFKGEGGKMVPSHIIALRAISPALSLMKKDTKVPAAEVKAGQLVSLTGSVLDGNLTDADLGHDVVIIYDGLGEKSKGRNRAKLFTVKVGPKSEARA